MSVKGPPRPRPKPKPRPIEAKCIECGGGVCICNSGPRRWAAHCMDCNNTIGVRGFYDPCAKSEKEARERWDKLNSTKQTKIEFAGYMRKTDSIKDFLMWEQAEWVDNELCLVLKNIGDSEMFKVKGPKRHWDTEDWPPKKIRLTIEEVD